MRDQPAPVNPNGKGVTRLPQAGSSKDEHKPVQDPPTLVNSNDKVVTRLSQAGSSKGGQVHTSDDGIKSSSEAIVQKCINNNLEEGSSIKATTETFSTGGQQPANSKTDAHTAKEGKGRGKHKGKKPKVTFT